MPVERQSRFSRTFWTELAVVLSFLLVLSAVIRFASWDLAVQDYFYRADEGWWAGQNPLVLWLYRVGCWPAIAVGVYGLIVWLLSGKKAGLVRFRSSALYTALVLIVGPGIIINAVFKANWGRPRPREIERYEGTRAFVPVGSPGIWGKGKSFPSGHASMGFFWCSLYILHRRGNRRRARGYLLVTLVHGGAMGVGRIAQGGHFLSDVVWSAGFVYLTSLVLYAVLVGDAEKKTGKGQQLGLPTLRETWGALRA